VAILAALAFQAWGLQRQHSQIEQLDEDLEELRSDHDDFYEQWQEGPPGGMEGRPPEPGGREPDPEARRGNPGDGARPQDGERPQGGRRPKAPGMDRMPDDEAFKAHRVDTEEKLASYIYVAEFDVETAELLEDEIDRTFEAQKEVRAKVAAEEITDSERRDFLQAERFRQYENVHEILEEDEAALFLEEVLGLSTQAQERLLRKLEGE